MNNKIIYIAIIIILFSVLFVLFRPIKSSAPNTETKTETTYSPGQTQQLYKPGKDSITTRTKSVHAAVTLKPARRSFSVGEPSAADSSYTFTAEDSTYKLSQNIQPASDGNLSMDYFLDLTSKELIRIDTIYQLRIDTLKIKQTITERIEPPFYNTFLFGAITTALVVILLIHFIP